MSSEVVRELFRNLETTLHDRLKVIEDILSTTRSSSAPSASEFNDFEAHIRSEMKHELQRVEDQVLHQIMIGVDKRRELEARVEQVERWIRSTAETLQTINTTVGSLQKRMDDERPVEAVEVEAEIEAAQEAALNAEPDAVVVEAKAKATLQTVVAQLEEEEEVEEEEVEVEEEEVEEEVEEEELELEEFTFKTKTYYRDQNLNVYIADEDGAVDPSEVVGIWNPKTKKIDRVPNA